jgi:putative Mn2+ efflux pump MntP
MGLIEIILIAVGLAMDAFAVSVTLGLSNKNLTPAKMMIPGVYFGAFQALMPLIGYFAGINFASKIQSFEHWIAFALLGFIGGKMIWDSFSKEPEKEMADNGFGFVKMLLLGIATSIDALAVGVTLAFFNVKIFIAAAIIGAITFVLSGVGVKIGNIFGTKYKSKAEFIGGAVLVLIGIKIVIEHVFLGKG